MKFPQIFSFFLILTLILVISNGEEEQTKDDVAADDTTTTLETVSLEGKNESIERDPSALQLSNKSDNGSRYNNNFPTSVEKTGEQTLQTEQNQNVDKPTEFITATPPESDSFVDNTSSTLSPSLDKETNVNREEVDAPSLSNQTVERSQRKEQQLSETTTPQFTNIPSSDTTLQSESPAKEEDKDDKQSEESLGSQEESQVGLENENDKTNLTTSSLPSVNNDSRNFQKLENIQPSSEVQSPSSSGSRLNEGDANAKSPENIVKSVVTEREDPILQHDAPVAPSEKSNQFTTKTLLQQSSTTPQSTFVSSSETVTVGPPLESSQNDFPNRKNSDINGSQTTPDSSDASSQEKSNSTEKNETFILPPLEDANSPYKTTVFEPVPYSSQEKEDKIMELGRNASKSTILTDKTIPHHDHEFTDTHSTDEPDDKEISSTQNPSSSTATSTESNNDSSTNTRDDTTLSSTVASSIPIPVADEPFNHSNQSEVDQFDNSLKNHTKSTTTDPFLSSESNITTTTAPNGTIGMPPVTDLNNNDEPKIYTFLSMIRNHVLLCIACILLILISLVIIASILLTTYLLFKYIFLGLFELLKKLVNCGRRKSQKRCSSEIPEGSLFTRCDDIASYIHNPIVIRSSLQVEDNDRF